MRRNQPDSFDALCVSVVWVGTMELKGMDRSKGRRELLWVLFLGGGGICYDGAVETVDIRKVWQ